MNRSTFALISMFLVVILGQRLIGLQTAEASFKVDICFSCELDKGLDEMKKSMSFLKPANVLNSSLSTQSLVGGLVDPIVVNLDNRANSRTL